MDTKLVIIPTYNEKENIAAIITAVMNLPLGFHVLIIDDFLANTSDSDDIYVIGGESLYRDLLPYCKRAYVTKVDATADDADAFMVNLDSHPDWEIEEIGEELEEKGYTFRFVTYKKK